MSSTQKVPEVSEPWSDSPETTTSQQRHRFKLFHRGSSGLKLFRRPSRSPPSPSGQSAPTAQPHSSSSETTSQTPGAEVPTAYSSVEVSAFDAMALSRLALRVSVQRGRHLAAHVEENAINPYAILSCAGRRQRTQVVRKSEDPDWECTFDVCLAGTGSRSSRKRQQLLLTNGLVLTVCTKDRFKSVIIGQVRIPIEEIFQDGDTVSYDDSNNEAKWYPLREAGQRRRRQFLLRRKKVQQKELDLSENESPAFQDVFGRVEMKIGLVYQPSKADDTGILDDVPGEDKMRELWKIFLDTMRLQYGSNITETADESSSSLPSDVDNLRITQSGSCPEQIQKDSDRPRRRRFRRRRKSKSASPKLGGSRKRRIVPRKLRRKRSRSAQIARFYSDVVGVMFLEVSHANDLPPERNMTRTGFDMDPFVIISYGTHTFRTRTVRHNLNPTWNEKLYFHVRRTEGNYKLKFAIYDHDKLSNNDYVAWKEIPIMDIIKESHDTTEKIIATEIPAEAIEADMGLHTVDLEMVNKAKWQDKHHPTLTFRAKFVPYREMRKMFWVALAKTYDVNGDGSMSRLELQSMLESLGSTISENTLNGFWTHYGKDPESDELTLEELVDSLESFMLSIDRSPRTISRVSSKELISVDSSETAIDSSDVEDTDSIQSDDFEPVEEDADGIEPGMTDDEDEYYSLVGYDDDDEEEEKGGPTTSSSGSPSDEADLDEILEEAKGVQYASISNQQQPLEGNLTPSLEKNKQGHREDYSKEKVIRLAECPICHRPNLSRRAQMDIVTHVATCAANDWTTVDRFIMGNFVTEAYAQRRWFVKLVSKVGYGRYQLGRDNANIIVQDRLSGQLIEERMSVYVRLGMRLLYKGMKTGIQSRTARRILTNLTIKQGKKYDSPLSAREILPFIKFHQLDMSEVLEPIENFKTFNEFFYRKLKPNARPCEHPDNPRVIVSPADCRMMAFNTIDDATRLWIKGLEFSVEKLLGDAEKAQSYLGGSLGVFRLAPQDYHRFHSPVDGVITDITYISGQYFTVNPMAIRTTLDVYGENARAIIHMDTDEFGKVAIACIGAMMVGSIILTAKVGDRLARTDELGYFAFGGSTLVVLWEKETMTFDDDLLENSEKALETLVRVGNRIATSVKDK